MKRCPECRRDYYDDSLLYCLDDGAALLEGPAGADEPETAILHSTDQPSEGRTAAQIHTTQRTEILPNTTTDKAAPQRRYVGRIVAAVVAVAILLAGAGFTYRYFSGSGRINSIAVLPLQNNSGNADSEYLSDGLAESLIYRLSQVPDLKVSPASSVMRYKGKEFDAQKIATELGVQAVMSGRMIQRGDNLTISVELIDAANNKTIWGEQFERKMSDLLATQREIATVITDKLQLKLAGSQSTGVTKKYTDNNEAYQLYLKGRFYWNKRTEADINRSIEFFDQAIALDPNFALAYCGLADSYQVLPSYAADPKPAETYPKARTIAQKAIELDPTLAEPHAALGVVLHEFDWNFPEAEKEFKRAIELNPSYASAHQWYGEFLSNMLRHDEAIAEMKRAQQLDPMSLIINTALGGMYHGARRYDESIEQYKKTLEIDPNFLRAHVQLAGVYRAKGMFEEAQDQSQKRRLLEGLPREEVEPRIEQVRAAYRAAGPRGYWQKVMELEQDAARKKGSEIDPLALAAFQVGIGNNEAALSSLEKTLASGSRDIRLVQLQMEPAWDPIRGDPRFHALLEKVGFPKS